MSALIDVRGQLIALQHKVVSTGLQTFRESSMAALDASHERELQTRHVHNSSELRNRLHEKQIAQRHRLLSEIHAVDQKLSHLLLHTNADRETEHVRSIGDAERLAAAKIGEMHSLLADHESRIEIIVGTTEDSNEAPAEHSSLARSTAMEMWGKGSEAIIRAGAKVLEILRPHEHMDDERFDEREAFHEYSRIRITQTRITRAHKN